jgi:hypothetical protein
MSLCTATIKAWYTSPNYYRRFPPNIHEMILRCEKYDQGYDRHEGDHVCTLPHQAGEDAGKLYVWPR